MSALAGETDGPNWLTFFEGTHGQHRLIKIDFFLLQNRFFFKLKLKSKMPMNNIGLAISAFIRNKPRNICNIVFSIDYNYSNITCGVSSPSVEKPGLLTP